jgi:hypothetical protein
MRKELVLSAQTKLFFKIPFPSKIFKTANPQPTRQPRHRPTMTAKNATNDKNGRQPTSVLRNGG